MTANLQYPLPHLCYRLHFILEKLLIVGMEIMNRSKLETLNSNDVLIKPLPPACLKFQPSVYGAQDKLTWVDACFVFNSIYAEICILEMLKTDFQYYELLQNQKSKRKCPLHDRKIHVTLVGVEYFVNVLEAGIILM